jgi:hypothetical protein
LQFAKASAATLSQQEKNDTEDVQRGKSTYIRQNELGVGLRRPCRGQACGGMLGAMARIAPAGGTARSTEA